MTPENNPLENEEKKLETEKLPVENEKNAVEEVKDSAPNNSEKELNNPEELTPEKETIPEEEHPETEEEASGLSLAEIMQELESMVNKKEAGTLSKKFTKLKQEAQQLIADETEDKKKEFTDEGNPEENFSWEHPLQAKLTALGNIFKEKLDQFHKELEQEQKQNKEKRLEIIERLKNLYTNSDAETNLFKEIRKIKEDWANAGQVAKNEFRILNNNYYHHLNQFYALLDLNKEYLEQEYTHNLEKRKQIIARAKELENEPVIQKALNELQYLHKLWKEEAEPVAEEFRESTWEEFKEISNKIHERKSELSAQIEEIQKENLEKKNKIIEEIKSFINTEKENNHNFWQNAIKKVEELRSEFLKTGSVPRKLSNQNWNDFKQTLRDFNSKKNTFYKSLKENQVANLEEKLKLIQTAKDNMLSEDWETAVPLFKKLQDDWKKIGHVPRSHANKIWDEFRDACNTFFNNFREKNNAVSDNWKENYKQKKALLDELKTVTDEEGSVEKIEKIKTAWNSIGKVPREKMSINKEFNQTLKDKLKLNKINEFDLNEEGLSEEKLTDKARKIKSQISDLEAEVAKLENNLGFFSNSSRENPLLKDTYNKIDEKKATIESLKQSLHNIINNE